MKQDNYKQANQFLINIRQKITNLKQTKDPLSILLQINKKIKSQHLSIIIILHNKNYLVQLLQETIVYYQKNKDKNKEITQNIQILYAIGFQCFLKYEAEYSKFINYFDKKLTQIKIQKVHQKYKKQKDRYRLLCGYFIQFYELNKSQKYQNFQKGKKLNEYVQAFKLSMPISAYEQSLFTWLRIKIQFLQNLIIKNKQNKYIGFCCRLHFKGNSKQENIQTQRQNFHKFIDFKKLKEKDDVPVNKHIVSYLNSYGGIFYIGIQLSPTRTAYIYGIPIDENRRIELLDNILQGIIRKIYPDDNEKDDQDDKAQQQRINGVINLKKAQIKKASFVDSKFNYDLTKYISVDFINLYNSETWLYQRQNNAINYVVRIKVKQGDQYQVYHYINNNDIPKAYLRQDKKQKELSMIQYYDLMYLKLKNKKQKKIQDNKISCFHNLCRFKIRIQQEKK